MAMASDTKKRPISTIVIVVAMQTEALPIVNQLQLKEDLNSVFPKGVPWVRYHGAYKDLDISIIWPGKDTVLGVDCIGTISASLVTYASIQALEPDLIINAGTAGGFKVIMESANRPPVLDGTNFDHWKAKMEAYMKAIDEDVWMACKIKYTPPTETNGETSRPKPSGKYSPAEKTERAANSRALNILFTYVDTKEFHRISTCKFAKEAWDILVTTHEGTDTVKQGKLQRITTQFEMIRMEEDETFDEFYAKLNHIVNTSYSLGSKALDNILEVQKPTNDRSGLGYHASSSNKVEGAQSSTIFLNERTEAKGATVGDIFLVSHVTFRDRRIPIPVFDLYGIGLRQAFSTPNLLRSLNLKVGKLSTSDSFEAQQVKASIIENDATLEDMEGAAVAYVADILKVPAIFIKAVTNFVDGDKPPIVECRQNWEAVTAALGLAVAEVVDFINGKFLSEL